MALLEIKVKLLMKIVNLEYFKSGKLYSEIIYKNGKRKYVEYYENLKIEGSLIFS